MRAGGVCRRASGAGAATALAAVAVALGSNGASAEPSAPVLSAEVPAGHGTTTPARPCFDRTRRVDGNPSDWRGRATGLGGATAYSCREPGYRSGERRVGEE